MSGAILIIGAGPGIGLAAAERFGREGWTVVLGARSPHALDAMVARLVGEGVDAHSLVVDATDAARVQAAVRNADRLTGGLTTVLYNAAAVRQQDLFSMTDAEVSSDVAVNITGGLNTIRAAEAIFAGRGGTILVTGGGLALSPHAGWASLGLGKAALRNLVEGLAPDLEPRGIRIAIANVATLVAPESAEARGAAETLWSLAADPASGWERTWPAAA